MSRTPEKHISIEEGLKKNKLRKPMSIETQVRTIFPILSFAEIVLAFAYYKQGNIDAVILSVALSAWIMLFLKVQLQVLHCKDALHKMVMKNGR